MWGSFDKFLRGFLRGRCGGALGCLELATGDVKPLDVLVLTVVVLSLGIKRSQGGEPGISSVALYGEDPQI